MDPVIIFIKVSMTLRLPQASRETEQEKDHLRAARGAAQSFLDALNAPQARFRGRDGGINGRARGW